MYENILSLRICVYSISLSTYFVRHCVLFNYDRVSFRCGIFFAGKNLKDKPFEKLFIIPKRFPVNRTLGDGEGEILEPEVYSNDVCPLNDDPYGSARSYGGSAQNQTCYFIVSTSCIKREYFVGKQLIIISAIILKVLLCVCPILRHI